MTLKEPLGFTVLSLLMPCLLLWPQAGSATQPLIAPERHRLQGYWEGKGPPGEISITITGNSLHFYSRPEFWYEATFTLPAETDPRQLHATITDSSPPVKDIGHVVFAIFKVEDGILTLAVDDGSDAPPTSFSSALSRYILEKVQSQEKSEALKHFGDPISRPRLVVAEQPRIRWPTARPRLASRRVSGAATRRRVECERDCTRLCTPSRSALMTGRLRRRIVGYAR